jgi:uncharacterized repeat protein (TIGR01451 family)
MKKLIVLNIYIIYFSAWAQIPTAGLVAGYSFSGNANDESPNNNNGILHGVTPDTARDGTLNGAYHFNGAGNYIVVPNSSSLTATSVSFCAVVKPQGFNSMRCQISSIFFKGRDHTTGFWGLYFGDNVYDNNDCLNYDPSHQTFFTEMGANTPISTSDELYTPFIAADSWYCVVGTYDGSNIKLYIDGLLKYTVAASYPIGNNSNPISIGCNLYDTVIYPYWLKGVIDDIRIYNRVLSPSEIMQYYLATSGINFDHRIHGNLYNDSTQDCQMQSAEIRLPYYTLVANPGAYYTVADDSGNYELGVDDTALYTVNPIIPQYLAPLMGNPCPLNYIIDIDPSVASDTGDFNFGFEIADCAVLRIDVAGNRKRRCFMNTTTVFYTNDGVASADSVTIYVQFDQYDIPVSASLPYALDTVTNTLIFDIGTLAAGQSGTITIMDSVACIPGITDLTQCTHAWILPPNTCLNDSTMDTDWDHSSMSVDGDCVNDTIRFVIYNDGTGNMTSSSEYRIYENNVLVFTGTFQLNSGDSLVIWWVSGGATVRLEANQSSGHPGNSQPRVTIENCGDDGSGNYTLEQEDLVPQDDDDADVEIDCMVIVDSYDPNEKHNSPGGVDAAHIVLPNRPIDYTVHFQNTGSDTAFRVMIIDTLSADLDMASFERGTSSYPYTLMVYGQGNPVLHFILDNINLVPASANELASSGFIKYKITPKSSTPLGTQINNYADIIFDFNTPVRTNLSFVTLGNYTQTKIDSYDQNDALTYYPNPATSTLNIEAGRGNFLRTILIYSIDARLISRLNFKSAEKTVRIDLSNYPPGMYFLDCISTQTTEKIKVVKN